MSFLRKIKVEIRGISLVEVLVAMAIFATVATVSTTILIEVVKLEKKSSIQNVIYEDAQIILQQLTKEIQQGTIDYEEYFNINVAQAGNAIADTFYGINYGAYSSRFYDPGLRLDGGAVSNPADLGLEWSILDEVKFTLSTDRNTGKNPFTGDPDKSNAFCDMGAVGKCGPLPPIGQVDELYLIDSTGTRKTILARRQGVTDNDWVLGLMRMEGVDLDQNGVIDTFRCLEEFRCLGESQDELESVIWPVMSPLPFVADTMEDGVADLVEHEITLPRRDDLEANFSLDDGQFVAISPLRSNLEKLVFIIHPLDDPYKAYAEPKMQSHPSVTIILTLGLSEETAAAYPGEFNSVTLQTTVAAGVVGKINAYPPTRDLDWLKNLGLTSVP